MANQGQLQIYTGDGKGKTTCAIGLCIRAAAAGLKVAFIQFDKGSEENDFYSERKILRSIKEIEVIVTGKIRMMPNGQFRFANSPPDFEEAKRGLEIAKKAIKENKYQLVVCDEILSCILTSLLKEQDVLDLIRAFEEGLKSCELVLTGRGLTEAIKEKADLVTEMKMIKHYFNKGLPARKGIEF
ncbi:MAG: cob(I)yrinic acid a,c-diamide adenosyltransferase [Oligoflexia bacterium]|nr:cob(I)yrinic acid a,c-diamide adenosyltransferase [Oligoflexia bacterium]